MSGQNYEICIDKSCIGFVLNDSNKMQTNSLKNEQNFIGFTQLRNWPLDQSNKTAKTWHRCDQRVSEIANRQLAVKTPLGNGDFSWSSAAIW
jgi:hypothetical protein